MAERITSMTIFFFTRDPETGLVYAGCKADGKRFISIVRKQGDEFYVVSGAEITKDRKRHNFTPEQAKALSKFISSGSMNFENWAGLNEEAVR